MTILRYSNHFDAIAKALEKDAAKAIKDGVKMGVQETRKRAPKKTGNMRRAIYSVTSTTSTYGRGKVEHLLPEIPHPTDKYTGYFAAGADYSIYVDGGTRWMLRQEFWLSGTLAANQLFQQRIYKITDALNEAMR